MCSFKNCDRKIHGKGLCQAHYMQRRQGIELKPLRNSYKTTSERKAAASRRSLSVAEKKREMVQALKLKSGCVDCGYNSHPEALEFDHIKDNKEANISKLIYSGSWERLLAEIAKCEIVCANCHRIRTVSRR